MFAGRAAIAERDARVFFSAFFRLDKGGGIHAPAGALCFLIKQFSCFFEGFPFSKGYGVGFSAFLFAGPLKAGWIGRVRYKVVAREIDFEHDSRLSEMA
jgi:hypothetical protein